MEEYEVRVKMDDGREVVYAVHARSPEDASALADDLARLLEMGLVK